MSAIPTGTTSSAFAASSGASPEVPLLLVQGAEKRFGGLQALSDVGISIARGQIYGLIGPNGAGKTTFFNVITGLYTPDAGRFELNGKPYSPTAVHEVAKAGIARTFQNIRLFAEMTVLENVMVGRHIRTHAGAFAAMLRLSTQRREEAEIRERAMQLLDYVGIARYAPFQSRTLSYGDQRRLDIAVIRECAVEHPAAGRARAEGRHGMLACGDHIRVECHAHIIIGAKQDRFLAIDDSHGGRFHFFHHKAERVCYAGGEQTFALGD